MGLGPAATSAACAVTAALMRGDAIPVSDRIALYDRAVGLVLPVCETGPWDALRDLAACAQHDALAADTPESLRQAAVRLLAAFDRREVPRAVITSATLLGDLTSDAHALLALSKAHSIWAIAERAAADPASPIATPLRALALRLGAETWREVIARIGQRSPAELEPLVPILAELPAATALEAARALHRHMNARVRRRGLALLLSLQPRDVVWRSLVEEALAGTDGEAADIARSAILRDASHDLSLLERAVAPGTPEPGAGRLREALLAAAEQARRRAAVVEREP